MATRVSEEELKKIRELGMARSLREVANGNATPEFAEAVRRYYPKAKYGPKTKAAAEAATPKHRSPGDELSKVYEDDPRYANLKGSGTPGRYLNKKVTTAVKRRIEPPPVAKKSNLSQRNNLAGRKQNRGIGVFDAVMDRHRSLDKQFKKTNPKVKKSIADFFTGNKTARTRAAQRPRSGKRT